MKYLHIISCDKFTDGFINFIYNNFDFEEHAFIVYGKNRFTKKYTEPNILSIQDFRGIPFTSLAKTWIHESELIIVNGVFGGERCLIYYIPRVLKKTYLMLWGGDFYGYRQKKLYNLGEIYRKFIIKNAAGVINLIERDYQELCKIVHPKGKHFIAPMADDGYTRKLIKKFGCFPKRNKEIVVLVGNSATKTNGHLFVLQLLEKFCNENIKILCPLSYGDVTYRDEVIRVGKKLFDEKFTPLTSYMEKERYIEMLSHVDIAIFNNNRQQAMGNISACLGLGAKVFIRNDTSMWNHYTEKLHYCIYDINTISRIAFDKFVAFDSHIAEHNRAAYFVASESSKTVNQWQAVFDSIKR